MDEESVVIRVKTTMAHFAVNVEKVIFCKAGLNALHLTVKHHSSQTVLNQKLQPKLKAIFHYVKAL